MSTYIIRPNSVATNGGGTNPATQATVLGNLSDNSDATFVTNTGSSEITWNFGLATAAVPSTQFVARVSPHIRHKGNAQGNYTIGGVIFRASDPNVSALNYIYPSNSAAFTSAQLGTQSVDWPLSDLASLRFRWYDGRATTAWNATEHADIWATVYAITKSTATPQSKTETQSVLPTVQVNLTNTLGWESSVPAERNIRKVLVQTRVELGGTTPGTGTLVATGSTTTTVMATSTVTLNQIVSNFIPNGTYRVYSRAHRYRDDPIVRDEQWSAWSAAATLTMNVPLPTTPTVTVTPDQALDRVAISVTPIATTNYANPFIFVERSDDGQQTWSAVRNAAGIQGTFGVAQIFYDYEAPRGTTVFYRVQIEATYLSVVQNSSLYSSAISAVVTADGWNFKDPDEPQLNVLNVSVTGNPTESVTEEQGVFRPLGRKYPVVVSGAVSGWDGDLRITAFGNAEWLSVKYLAESQQVLYLEAAFGWAKYIRILSGTTSAIGGTTTTPIRQISLKYVEVERPAITIGDSGGGGALPSVLDGGNANPTFTLFLDGGDATSTWTQSVDGGAAA